MDTIIIAAFAAITAVIGSIVTWRVARRHTSGEIDTSEAADLWAEGGKIRSELREELKETKAALREAANAVIGLRDEIRLSRQETTDARNEALKLQVQLAGLVREVAELHLAIKTGNILTIGGLADNAESRRIMALPKEDRTESETEHLDTAGERLPPNQAADQSKDRGTA